MFSLAKRVLDRHLRDEAGNERPWYFPKLVPIVRTWLREHVRLKDGTFLGLLRLAQHEEAAVGRIEQGLARVAGARSERRLPLLRAFEPQGSTADVDFATTKDVWLTGPSRCPVSHVVLDSGWEEKVASVLESLPQVVSYVKNDHLGFAIPYVLDGQQRSYLPDFLLRARTEDDEPALTVVVEVSQPSAGTRTPRSPRPATCGSPR